MQLIAERGFSLDIFVAATCNVYKGMASEAGVKHVQTLFRTNEVAFSLLLGPHPDQPCYLSCILMAFMLGSLL